MSSFERLLLAWIFIVVMGAIYYFVHPKRGWIKKLRRKLTARR